MLDDMFLKRFIGKRTKIVYKDGKFVSVFKGLFQKFDDDFIYGSLDDGRPSAVLRADITKIELEKDQSSTEGGGGQ